MRIPSLFMNPIKLCKLQKNESDLGKLLRASRKALAKWGTRSDQLALVHVLCHIDDQREILPAPMHRGLRTRVRDALRKRGDFDKLIVWSEARVEPPEFVWRSARPDGCPMVVRHRPPCQRRRTAQMRCQLRETGPPQKPCCPRTRNEADDNLLALASRHRRDNDSISAPLPVFRFQKALDFNLTEPQYANEFTLFDDDAATSLGLTAGVRYPADVAKYVTGTVQRLHRRGPARTLAGPIGEKALAILSKQFPHATALIQHLRESSALARLVTGAGLTMRPILLVGDPGIGKTALVQAIGRALGVPFHRVDGAGLSTAAEIVGVSTTWATGRTGIVFESLCDSDSGSPVIFIDELDKMHGNQAAPVMPALLSLLEPETSRTFRDESLDLPIDASRILWFAASNTVQGLPDHVLSRFNVFHLPRPTPWQTIEIAKSIYGSLLSRHAWGRLFPTTLANEVLMALSRYLPREIARILEKAFGKAAAKGRTHLRIEDIEDLPPATHRMGF